MSAAKQNGLLILGAPFSGASALAGCLHLLGVKLGSRLGNSGSSSDGPGGFETLDVVQIHDILLHELGCDWKMVGSLPPGWPESEAAEQAKERLKKFILREFKGARVWCVNDPRLCRLMPLWERVFTELQMDPGLVVWTRHPDEVAGLLRSQQNFEQGRLLWLGYYQEALAVCADRRHCVLTYDELVANPISLIDRMGDSLGIRFPRSANIHSQKILDFVRSEKGHSRTDPAEKNGEPSSESYEWLYDQLRFRKPGDALPEGTEEHIVESVRSQANRCEIAAGPLPILAHADDGVVNLRSMSAVSEVFSNLLVVISEYERSALSHQAMKERLLLQSCDSGNLLACELRILNEDESGAANAYSDNRLLPENEWTHLTFAIPQPRLLRKTGLRFAPINQPGTVSISAMRLLDPSRDTTIWSSDSQEGGDPLAIEGSGFAVGGKGSPFRFLITGNNFEIVLSPIPELPDSPLSLEVWLEVKRGSESFQEAWESVQEEVREKDERMAAMGRQVQEIRDQLRELAEGNKRLLRDVEEKTSAWAKEKKSLSKTCDSKDAEIVRLEEQLEKSNEVVEGLEQELKDTKQRRKKSEARLAKLKIELRDAFSGTAFHPVKPADHS